VIYTWMILAASLLPAAVESTEPAVLDPATRADVRCVVAISNEAGLADDSQINHLAILAYYFIGRLDGRTPGLNLQKAFEQEAHQMTDSEYMRLRQSCREQYLQRAKDFNSVARPSPVGDPPK
jgi:hypothetical protein